jgi:hypothetical protein
MDEVGHGFSMTGSLGVEAEIFVRGNYFTENSHGHRDSSCQRLCVRKLCGHIFGFVFFRTDRCLGKSFLVKPTVLCLHFKALSLSIKALCVR